MSHKNHGVYGPPPRGRRDDDGFGPQEMPFGPRGRMHRGRPGGPFGPGFGPGGPGFGAGGPGFGPGPRGAFGPQGPFGRGRARRGEVRTAILQLLAEEPRNGYQIISEIAERSGGIWRPSPGAVYPALNQLEDEGLVEAFDNEGARAFRLTDAGRETPEVHTDTPRVWEAWAGQGTSRADVRSVMREYGELSIALKAVAMSNDATTAARAQAILADTKRALYALLAAAPEPEDDAAE